MIGGTAISPPFSSFVGMRPEPIRQPNVSSSCNSSSNCVDTSVSKPKSSSVTGALSDAPPTGMEQSLHGPTRTRSPNCFLVRLVISNPPPSNQQPPNVRGGSKTGRVPRHASHDHLPDSCWYYPHNRNCSLLRMWDGCDLCFLATPTGRP